jgi:DNA-binding NtrC family response regulator
MRDPRGTETSDVSTGDEELHATSERYCLGLAVVWSKSPEEIGLILRLFAGEDRFFGRGVRAPQDAKRRVVLEQIRPSFALREGAPFVVTENPLVSREQLRIRNTGARLQVENLGKRPLLDAHGEEHGELTLAPGDVVEVKGQMVFVCVRHKESYPALRSFPTKLIPAFGQPDCHGFVGESFAAWELREHCAFLAARKAHVLLLGPSGSGKEIIARAIHKLSARGKRPLVSRSAATIPASLIDAELFGNIENYPQSGMPARAGLVGEADGSTLFLDEIGELAEELQTRLLRFLDDGGEYQRLGDPKRRTADMRFLAATNRPIDALKHDVAARLKLRLTLPGLAERREDIMPIAFYMLRRATETDAELGLRFFEQWTGGAQPGGKQGAYPRISAELARELVAHNYTAHVRELDALLWCSLTTSPGQQLELTAEVLRELRSAAKDDTEARSEAPSAVFSREQVEAALQKHQWVQEKVWRDLGMTNRYVLKRLVKKFALKRPSMFPPSAEDEPV